MGIQIIEVLFIFGWVSFTMGIFFSVLKYVGWLRADELEEEVGMDLSRHKGTAYNVEDTNEETVKQLEMSRHRSSLGEDISVKKQEEAAVADDQEIEA